MRPIAHRRAAELGLESKRGKTGGASELARGGLYTFLGLGLPEELQKLVPRAVNRVKATRDEILDPDRKELLVTVHHRIDEEFRKKNALLHGKPLPGRSTTRFSFPPGELPHFLVPYVLLTELGAPYVTLNLEGRLSPRLNALGELISAEKEATLRELQQCLEGIAEQKEARAKADLERDEQQARGEKILRDWHRRCR